MHTIVLTKVTNGGSLYYNYITIDGMVTQLYRYKKDDLSKTTYKY